MINFHEIGLISRMRAGRSDAFTEVYDKYSPRLMGYARQLTGDCGEAEDLVQETMLAAWNGRATFHGRVKLVSWLLGIMSRRWRDRCRHRQVATISLAQEVGEFEGLVAESSCIRLEIDIINRLTMDDALATLPLPFREALLLIHSQGLTYKEAAVVLGTPIGTVKWRVAEALARVQRQLAASEEEIDGVREASVSTAS